MDKQAFDGLQIGDRIIRRSTGRVLVITRKDADGYTTAHIIKDGKPVQRGYTLSNNDYYTEFDMLWVK